VNGVQGGSSESRIPIIIAGGLTFHAIHI
jgi:hypothetical protein